MKISKFIFEVKNKLAQGELKQGLDMLISTIEYDDSTTQNSLIVISASFEELKKEKNRGVVRDTDYSLRYNKILVQILEIIDDVQTKNIELREDLIANDENDEIYNLNNITNLLIDGNFSRKDLLQYCASQRPLKKLHSKILESNVKKATIAHLMVSNLHKKSLLDNFLDWAQSVDSESFKKFEPYEVEQRNDNAIELFSRVVEKYREHLPQERPPKILIAGAFGNGKSTTINCIFGTRKAMVAHDKKGTTESNEYLWNEENIFLVDVPGLGENVESDKKTKLIYKEWVRKIDGIIVVITAPRPFSTGTVETIDFLLNEGVPSNQIVFGLNKLEDLRYDDENGNSKRIQFDEIEGPIRSIDKISVEKLKINFVNDLNIRYKNSNFKIEQVIEYDAISSWNVHNLLLSVIEILPYQAIRRFKLATDSAIEKLEKKLKKEKKRNREISGYKSKSTQITIAKAGKAISNSNPIVGKSFWDEVGEGIEKIGRGEVVGGLKHIVKSVVDWL